MSTTTIKDVTDYLESISPLAYQEEYDNSGLITGDGQQAVHGVIVTLDCTEAVVEEAIQNKCNLIVAHHPIIFKGLKKITGKNYVERTIIKAIKNDIAIYAAHTNLDNVHTGVNKKIADQIGLVNTRILKPKTNSLSKLVTFIPKENAGDVLNALHKAGAGNIGEYKNCSFQVEGNGYFMPTEKAKPHIGVSGELGRVDEVRAEIIFPSHQSKAILNALREAHPYEEVAYYISRLENANQEVGSGMIGELINPIEPLAFLQGLKVQMNSKMVRHTKIVKEKIKRVAVCGGSGSFLLNEAIAQKADAFVSADFKYHEFFDAEDKIIIADIGHYESEQFTKDLIADVLKEKFTTFAIIFSKSVTNPLSYI
jgi:dinuclear metal center YbgI/SA1388 family protein